mgnify:CR=1 FL=1
MAIAFLRARDAELRARGQSGAEIATRDFEERVQSAIRSLPDETGNPQIPNALFARGIWQDDVIRAVPLGEFTTPEISLDLSFMQMGEGQHGPSWLCRTVALRDRLGPFRLAFLETLLRAADARASRETTI